MVISGDERDRYLAVLADWRFVNILIWTKDAQAKLDQFLPNGTPKLVGELMYEFACQGGDIVRKDEDL